MFQELQKRIHIITMAVTTTVLVLSGLIIMFFSPLFAQILMLPGDQKMNLLPKK